MPEPRDVLIEAAKKAEIPVHTGGYCTECGDEVGPLRKAPTHVLLESVKAWWREKMRERGAIHIDVYLGFNVGDEIYNACFTADSTEWASIGHGNAYAASEDSAMCLALAEAIETVLKEEAPHA